MKNYNIFNLRDLRFGKNLTQEELGSALGLTKSAISNYENGNRLPDINVLVLYSRFFGVSIDYIVGNGDFAQALQPKTSSTTFSCTAELQCEITKYFNQLSTIQQKQALGYIHGLMQE